LTQTVDDNASDTQNITLSQILF